MSSRSSKKAESVAVDDKIRKFTLENSLAETQGFTANLNMLFQDGVSTIKLADTKKYSSGKRTRHFVIRLFHDTDLVSQKKVAIKCFPAGKFLLIISVSHYLVSYST